MEKLQTLTEYLDQRMEGETFRDYLPIGLQVEGRQEVHKIATGVSASLELFEKARDWGADLIFVHHGMFWDREDRVLRGPLKKRVHFLLENNLSLIGYHLPLDAHPELGNNIIPARELGLENIAPFGLYHGKAIGFKGRISPQMPEAFLEKTTAFYGKEPVALLYGPEKIETVGIVSGGAWDLLPQAAMEGLDLFLTGTADEPVYHMAREWGIHFLAYGHHATERIGPRAVGEHLAEQFSVETRFFDSDNPL